MSNTPAKSVSISDVDVVDQQPKRTTLVDVILNEVKPKKKKSKKEKKKKEKKEKVKKEKKEKKAKKEKKSKHK